MTTLRFEDVRVRDTDKMDRAFYNKRFRLIVEAIASVLTRVDGMDAATDSLLALGITKVNEALIPAIEVAQAAAENGFLVATSSTSVQISETLETTFVVDDSPARQLFAATPFVVITREGATLDDWAVFEVASYDRETGALAGEVIGVNGAIGDAAYTDWIFSATSGLAKSVVEGIATIPGLISSAENAQAAAEAAAAAAELVLENGPVASVNGQTGVVLIGMSDIANLVTTLAGKASASHAHTIANINGLQTALNTLTTAISDLETDLGTLDGGTF